MKRFIISILAFLYISTSAGATIHLHYCMGKLVTWNLRHQPADRCAKCGMKTNHKSKNNGCCRDEYKEIKTDKDHKLSQAVFSLIHLSSIAIPTSVTGLSSIFLIAITETNPVSNAPPRSQIALYLRNCVFLI
jgi:hypothetical protein